MTKNKKLMMMGLAAIGVYLYVNRDQSTKIDPGANWLPTKAALTGWGDGARPLTEAEGLEFMASALPSSVTRSDYAKMLDGAKYDKDYTEQDDMLMDILRD